VPSSGSAGQLLHTILNYQVTPGATRCGTLKMRVTTLTGWTCHTWSRPAGFGQRSRMSAAHARAYACHRVGSCSRSVGPTLPSVRARVVLMRVRIAVGFINRNDPAQALPWSPSGSAATLRGWLAWSGRSRRPPNRVPRASARQGGVAVLGRTRAPSRARDRLLPSPSSPEGTESFVGWASRP
jgi:hypothetical protein